MNFRKRHSPSRKGKASRKVSRKASRKISKRKRAKGTKGTKGKGRYNRAGARGPPETIPQEGRPLSPERRSAFKRFERRTQKEREEQSAWEGEGITKNTGTIFNYLQKKMNFEDIITLLDPVKLKKVRKKLSNFSQAELDEVEISIKDGEAQYNFPNKRKRDRRSQSPGKEKKPKK